MYASFVGLFAHKDLTWNGFKEVTKASTSDVGAVMYLIPLCAIFSYGLVWDRIPEIIAEFLLGISGDSPYMLLGIIVIYLIIAGMFVDGSVLILMLTPIFLPIARQIGFDPVHFGLVFVLTITMGNMPPRGRGNVCSLYDPGLFVARIC
jgi:TRAP-type C4-dicarboxylate transport system permease large subunit